MFISNDATQESGYVRTGSHWSTFDATIQKGARSSLEPDVSLLEPHYFTKKYHRLHFDTIQRSWNSEIKKKSIIEYALDLVEVFRPISTETVSPKSEEELKAVLPEPFKKYTAGFVSLSKKFDTYFLKVLASATKPYDPKLVKYLNEEVLRFAIHPYNTFLVEFLLFSDPQIFESKSYVLFNAVEASATLDHIRTLIENVQNRMEFVNYISFDSKKNIFDLAYERGRDDLMALLIAAGADTANFFHKQSEVNLFFNAALEGDLPLIKFFHRIGFPINYRDQEYDDNTALHYAYERAQNDVFHFLLTHGADPCAVNADGETAEEYAKNRRIELHKNAVQDWILFVTKGITTRMTDFMLTLSQILDMNEVVDDKGNTLLHLSAKALTTMSVSSVKDLIERGADVTLHNSRGITAFEYILKSHLSRKARMDGVCIDSFCHGIPDRWIEEIAKANSIDLEVGKRNVYERDRHARERLINALENECELTLDEISDCCFDVININEPCNDSGDTLMHIAYANASLDPNDPKFFIKDILIQRDSRGVREIKKAKSLTVKMGKLKLQNVRCYSEKDLRSFKAHPDMLKIQDVVTTKICCVSKQMIYEIYRTNFSESVLSNEEILEKVIGEIHRYDRFQFVKQYPILQISSFEQLENFITESGVAPDEILVGLDFDGTLNLPVAVPLLKANGDPIIDARSGKPKIENRAHLREGESTRRFLDFLAERKIRTAIITAAGKGGVEQIPLTLAQAGVDFAHSPFVSSFPESPPQLLTEPKTGKPLGYKAQIREAGVTDIKIYQVGGILSSEYDKHIALEYASRQMKKPTKLVVYADDGAANIVTIHQYFRYKIPTCLAFFPHSRSAEEPQHAESLEYIDTFK